MSQLSNHCNFLRVKIIIFDIKLFIANWFYNNRKSLAECKVYVPRLKHSKNWRADASENIKKFKNLKLYDSF